MVDYTRIPVDLGIAPTGSTGDTSREGFGKVNDDLYQIYYSFTFDESTGKVTTIGDLDVGGAITGLGIYGASFNVTAVSPAITLKDASAPTTRNTVQESLGSDDYSLKLRTDANALVGDMAIADITDAGNSTWRWYINGGENMRLDATGLDITNDLDVGGAIAVNNNATTMYAGTTTAGNDFLDLQRTGGNAVRYRVFGSGNLLSRETTILGSDVILETFSATVSGAYSMSFNGAEEFSIAGGTGVDITNDLDVGGALDVGAGATIAGDIVYDDVEFRIQANTSSGTDTKAVALSGSGTITATRGAYIIAYGNNHASNPGDVLLQAGSAGQVLIGGSNFSVSPVGDAVVGGDLDVGGNIAVDDGLTLTKNGTSQTMALFVSDLGVNTRNFSIRTPVLDNGDSPFSFVTSNSFSFVIDGADALTIGAFGNTTVNNDLDVGGNIDATGLPTSDPAVAGRIWNDAGTLKVSAG